MGQAGFYVDGIVMDGAQWNRGVWTNFGISIDQFFCHHPYYEGEKLWFFSDFPHLLKCLRNAIMKLLEFWVTRNSTSIYFQIFIKLFYMNTNYFLDSRWDCKKSSLGSFTQKPKQALLNSRLQIDSITRYSQRI